MAVPGLKLVERVFEIAGKILEPLSQKLILLTVGKPLGNSEIA
ncbi:MAG: hypothetical protein OXG56_00330 [Gammaproteobacteria bacterium]|nr:hypothetical protein [Gammaproteobacteria bacterium]